MGLLVLDRIALQLEQCEQHDVFGLVSPFMDLPGLLDLRVSGVTDATITLSCPLRFEFKAKTWMSKGSASTVWVSL